MYRVLQIFNTAWLLDNPAESAESQVFHCVSGSMHGLDD